MPFDQGACGWIERPCPKRPCSKPAKFCTHFKWGCPELRAIAHSHAAQCVDSDQSAHRDPVKGDRGRAKPTLEVSGQRPCSCAHCPKDKIRGCRLKRCTSQGSIGVLTPCFVTAIDQIKENCGGHDWHKLIANGEAAPRGPQAIHHT